MIKKCLVLISILFILFISGWLTGCFTTEKSLPSIYYSVAQNMGQYTVKGKLYCYEGDELLKYLDGEAEKYLAYKIKSLSVQEYQNDSGITLTIEIYNMSNLQDAFGIYSLNRNPEARFVDLGNEGIITSYMVEFWKANFYVKLIHSAPGPKDDLIQIAKKLASNINRNSKEPQLVHLLPVKDYIPKSAKFFHEKISLDNIYYIPENFLELNNKTNGVVGYYQNDKERAKAFIIKYSSKDLAKIACKKYLKYLSEHKKNDATVNIFDAYIFGIWDGVDSKWTGKIMNELADSLGMNKGG
ncbi:hypothetical protein AUJ95_04515 [Candidatus Desantisbacteria bacterium CG2_30_40_21]|uniref:Uncharacterized protein n=5 Tax=unclassified Candidatus Desantisiibacteriota TaxID=3106372 RepID=A0A2M7JE98_9BACT|nr:MAG: hypothetical protein AUJ95_04515 [Candidatus Desantisbacteria bacterium CG2_30_40_21]PIP42553.1 MAG: hypothetical protein COX18_00055 [Candidatus Desantisbacteria bacterium CG23_combo_of_CG06-09_8_20_14_all_40_23]PIX17734.1 MAG: hypothetical protein COZ71_01740 [Candidatus Desantisbacteria bacterium CG_4_8_14_3_um_filter_40_12]PIY19946.1 MAG: hypothetical protein COZ13_02665 [Candidatus Desantisbacteria bacterium CG_4_10_14_3_um_filter_40_18]PJB30157.1 MAG: hypothetical protein CO110_02